MERYQVKTDKDSGIVNDPNDWAVEHNHPHYILDLLLKYYHRKRWNNENCESVAEGEILIRISAIKKAARGNNPGGGLDLLIYKSARE